MNKCFLVLLSLVITGEAAESLESVANSVRAKVIKTGKAAASLPSRARDVSVEIPRGSRKVGKTLSEHINLLPFDFQLSGAAPTSKGS